MDCGIGDVLDVAVYEMPAVAVIEDADAYSLTPLLVFQDCLNYLSIFYMNSLFHFEQKTSILSAIFHYALRVCLSIFKSINAVYAGLYL